MVIATFGHQMTWEFNNPYSPGSTGGVDELSCHFLHRIASLLFSK